MFSHVRPSVHSESPRRSCLGALSSHAALRHRGLCPFNRHRPLLRMYDDPGQAAFPLFIRAWGPTPGVPPAPRPAVIVLEPGLSKWSDGRLAGMEETNISSQRLGGTVRTPKPKNVTLWGRKLLTLPSQIMERKKAVRHRKGSARRWLRGRSPSESSEICQLGQQDWRRYTSWRIPATDRSRQDSPRNWV